MSAIPRSSNKAIHDALRVLAREIQSGDGAANVAIAEGADRISELGNEVERLQRENAALRLLADGHEETIERLERQNAALKIESNRLRVVLQDIADASGFDNIGNWARNKAKDTLAK